MDGNGRWAKEKGKSRLEGHEAGLQTFRKIALYASSNLPISHLTVYAFSVQNWSRPVSEIRGLFALAKQYFSEIEIFQKANIRLQVKGSLDLYPIEVQKIIETAIQSTQTNTGLVLTLALSYGGREEIVEAAEKIRQTPGKEPMTQEQFEAILNPEQIPDPDLIIRTSGEFRVSNFLLWQGSYSEYLILEKFWPDFTSADLDSALSCLAARERRFGKVLLDTDAQHKHLSELECNKYVGDFINSAKSVTSFIHTQKYKNNQMLFVKYQANYFQAITFQQTNYQSCSDSFLAALPELATENKSWISWLLFSAWLQNQSSLPPQMLYKLIRQTSSVLDLYRRLRTVFALQSDTEEQLKEKLISLTDFHREIYKKVLQTREESPILSTIYMLYPILYQYCSLNHICSLACFIQVLFFPDSSYPTKDQLCESILSQDDSAYTKISYYAKLKTALVYLSFFIGSNGIQNLHWGQILYYIQLSL